MMKTLFTFAAFALCLNCSAQTVITDSAVDSTGRSEPDYDLTIGAGFPLSTEGLFAGPQIITMLNNEARFPNVAIRLTLGTMSTVAGNPKVHFGGGIRAFTGNHVFEAGCMRYGIGNGKYAILDGATENGWMYHISYGYKTRSLYPFAEGTLLYANVREEKFETPQYSLPRLVRSTVVRSQSWWITAGAALDHEFPSHLLFKAKLGLGYVNSMQRVKVLAENEPERNYEESRPASMMIVCEFAIGYRFKAQ